MQHDMTIRELFPLPTEEQIEEYRNQFPRNLGRGKGSVRRARQALDPARNLFHLAAMLESDASDIEGAENLPIPASFIQGRQRSAASVLLKIARSLG